MVEEYEDRSREGGDELTLLRDMKFLGCVSSLLVDSFMNMVETGRFSVVSLDELFGEFDVTCSDRAHFGCLVENCRMFSTYCWPNLFNRILVLGKDGFRVEFGTFLVMVLSGNIDLTGKTSEGLWMEYFRCVREKKDV